jgi:hypothetical protein
MCKRPLPLLFVIYFPEQRNPVTHSHASLQRRRRTEPARRASLRLACKALTKLGIDRNTIHSNSNSCKQSVNQSVMNRMKSNDSLSQSSTISNRSMNDDTDINMQQQQQQQQEAAEVHLNPGIWKYSRTRQIAFW